MEILEFACFEDIVHFKKNDGNSIKKILKNKIQVGVAVNMVCGNTWKMY